MTALFCTDYRDHECPTQNAKTDELFDYDNFEDWFDNLICVFLCEDLDFEATYDDVISALKVEPDFIEQMKLEYEDLIEICSDDDDE
jgi:hypothetical protein